MTSVSPDGVIEWRVEKRQSVVGSYEANFNVKSCSSTHIFLDGNPAKWLQGHNLFGSDDLIGLVAAVMGRLTKILSLTPTAKDIVAWKIGDYDLKRVDCTAMWDLPRRSDVRAWLRAAEFQSKSRHGRPVTRGSTLYFGQNSRRWSVKFYSKGDELDSIKKGHKLPIDIANRDNLKLWADTKLRGELTLRSLELKDESIDKATAWKIDTPLKLLRDYVESMDMSDQFSLTSESLDEPPGRLVAVYKLWKDGEDLRGMYSRTTLYRYRSELLKHGIDIAIRQPVKFENVIPLVRVLRPEAIAQVPDWAIGTSLYYEPKQVRA